jgi:iron complex transport system permease protein
MNGRFSLLLALLLAAIAALSFVYLGLGVDPGGLSFDGCWPAALSAGDELTRNTLLYFRGPSLVSALIVGASLALAGLVLQGATRNPLADPFLLGISGGAGLFVVFVRGLAFVQGPLDWWLTPATAFVGGAAANFLVLSLARGAQGRVTTLGLILSGVVINAFCAALMTFLLARFHPFRLRVTTQWLAGGIGFCRWEQLAVAAIVLCTALVWLRLRAHQLNTFALGVDDATYVGVDSERLLSRSAIVASMLAAIGVSLAGLMGYVGLIVPHATRILLGQDFRKTLLPTALGGALTVLFAELGGRLVFAPEEFPTGILTAIMGCPILLVLLRSQLRSAR